MGRPVKVAAREVAPVMWPGISTGHRADCLCSWAYHHGRARMEVKFANSLCPVRHRKDA